MKSCSEDIFSSIHLKCGLHLYLRLCNCEMWWRAGWAQQFVSDRVLLHTLGAVQKNRVFSAWAHCAVFFSKWISHPSMRRLIASAWGSWKPGFIYSFLVSCVWLSQTFTIGTGIFHASFASKGDYMKITMVKEKGGFIFPCLFLRKTRLLLLFFMDSSGLWKRTLHFAYSPCRLLWI